MSKKFVITFAGDTSLGDWYVNKTGNEDLIQRLESNPESFFNGVEPIIKNSDYFIINFETVLVDSEPTIYFPDKGYPNWDKSERLLRTLRSIGVTAVNLANNHTMDFGPEVMLKTKELLEENDFKTFGASNSLQEAEQPLKITLLGEKSLKNIYIISGLRASKLYHEKYNFFASNDKPGVNSLNFNRICEQIKKIRNEDPSSFIILFPHWQGIDYKWASESKDIHELCSKFIENGVNYIIGQGPHILNHFEKRDTGNIAYSIGNFVWNAKGRYKKLQAPPYSAIGRLQFEEKEFNWSIESRFYPIVTDNRITDYQSRPVNEQEFENLIKVLSRKEESFWHGKDSRGFYISSNRSNSELPLVFQGKKTNDFIINNITLPKPNEYNNQIFSSKYLISKEFFKKGYTSTSVGKYLIVNIGEKTLAFDETESSYDSSIGARIAKDKTLAREFLKKADLSIAKGESFSIQQKEKALAYALSLTACVIKPSDGHKGIGITVGVKTREEFENAWNKAISFTNKKIIVEEQFIGGTEARCLVVGGCCLAAFSSISPNIVSNGIDTIEELIKQKNKIRLKNPHLRNRLIEIDNHRLSIINTQGYTLSNIPDKGINVIIDWNRNVGTGGDSLDITDEIHPFYKEIAVKAANSIPSLFVVGVDIIADNLFQEPQKNRYAILEVNTRPGIGGHHFPMYGKPRNVAKDIVEYCISRALKERN
ncbi:CapA family protein [Tissierella sp.]|uniref:CapA family protein n=1 Tax=Tissierella sp. TaxID=41274 RepID=UPI00285C8EB4|nr:CapA family protein [Tissierella sp.]MDR7855943.1 CapA family protein [Tissierella sp.]